LLVLFKGVAIRSLGVVSNSPSERVRACPFILERKATEFWRPGDGFGLFMG
jgi:hypothetical protein